MHLNLPTSVADAVIDAGWAEYHSLVGKGALPPLVVMLYGPRNHEELAVIRFVVTQAYTAAGGKLPAPSVEAHS